MDVPMRADIEAARSRIGAAVRRTPVLEVDLRDQGVDANVVIKLELTQHTGSFKARGALNSVLSVPAHVTGVCAASGGNHAAAVAWAARRAGLRADVFVPENATPAKLARIRAYGARIHAVEGYVKDALSTLSPQYWHLGLGIVLMASVFLVRGGIAGGLADLGKFLRRRTK